MNIYFLFFSKNGIKKLPFLKMNIYFSRLYDFHTKQKNKNNEGEACNCPCDDLVGVEAPKVVIMALSYIAPAFVVTIVGCNMGFRYVLSTTWERGGV